MKEYFQTFLSVNVTTKPKPDKNSRKENRMPVFQETKMKKSSVKHYVTFNFFTVINRSLVPEHKEYPKTMIYYTRRIKGKSHMLFSVDKEYKDWHPAQTSTFLCATITQLVRKIFTPFRDKSFII